MYNICNKVRGDSVNICNRVSDKFIFFCNKVRDEYVCFIPLFAYQQLIKVTYIA